jgi:hypothetical protein
VAAGIPEGFRPAKPERIAPGGPFAKRKGIRLVYLVYLVYLVCLVGLVA